MKLDEQSSPDIFQLRNNTLFLIAVWTLILLLSLYWNYRHDKEEIIEFAKIQARTLYEKDILYRQWNANHGGVYVPVTDETPPNPYLEVPEREITISSGKVLTLINPSYMTRQVIKLGQERYGVFGHITSLNPINPNNAPDPWEVEALKAFEDGVEEVSSSETIGGILHLRLMRPLITEKDCLNCHAKQGYKLGDIRGGISMSVPLHTYSSLLSSKVKYEGMVHALFWVIGLIAFYPGYVSIQRRVREREAAEGKLNKNQVRLQMALDAAEAGTWVLDLKTEMVSIDERMGEILNIEPRSYEATREFWKDLLHPDDIELAVQATTRAIKENQPCHLECRVSGKDNEWRNINADGIVVKDEAGNPSKIFGMTVDVTEQQKMEKELVEWGEMFKHAELGIAIGNVEGSTLDIMNPAFAKMYGYTVEELTGRPIVDIYAPEMKEELLAHIRLTHEKGHHTFESMHIRKDGAVFPALVDATTIKDEKGNVVKRVVNVRDLTEQKTIEKELDLQHRLKELFMDSLPCFAFLAKYDQTIVAINQAGTEMGGKVGLKCFSSKMTPFDKSCWWCQLPQLIETGERQYWEGCALGIHWEAHWVPIDDDLYLHYAFDVSDKVQAQQQIEDSEEKFRTTFMTIPDGIVLTRLTDNTFVDINEGFTAISGYAADEVIGKPVLEVEIWDDPDERARFLEEILKGGEVHNFETKGRRKDNSLFDALISAKTVTLYGKHHLISVFKDITERKKIEQALQRSAQLATVGQIASGVAHELNNPLATIAACAEVLEKYAAGIPADLEMREKIQEYVKLIAEEVEQGSNIIMELLDFARVRPLEMTKFKLCDLIESTVKLFSIQSIYKDYSFVVSTCEDPPDIMADRDRLRQVLIILLTNACEAMPNGGVVSVGCTKDLDNQQVVFSVTDEGTGISSEDKKRIFEPFYTTRLQEKGTGLGLSTADSIVTIHSGIISVQSELGKGSTFEVILPVVSVIQAPP